MEAKAAEPGIQAERALRTVTTLLVGKLLCDGKGETLCRIRNLSATGMLMESPYTMCSGEQVAVELRNAERLEGTIAWSRDGRSGVRFGAPVEVDLLLEELKPAAAGRSKRPRAPRFAVGIPARISSYGRTIDVMLEDVSQSGARLRLPRPPRRDSQVILAIPGLPPRRCTTRWAADEAAGLSFLDMIPYGDLVDWLKRGRPRH